MSITMLKTVIRNAPEQTDLIRAYHELMKNIDHLNVVWVRDQVVKLVEQSKSAPKPKKAMIQPRGLKYTRTANQRPITKVLTVDSDFKHTTPSHIGKNRMTPKKVISVKTNSRLYNPTRHNSAQFNYVSRGNRNKHSGLTDPNIHSMTINLCSNSGQNTPLRAVKYTPSRLVKNTPSRIVKNQTTFNSI